MRIKVITLESSRVRTLPNQCRVSVRSGRYLVGLVSRMGKVRRVNVRPGTVSRVNVFGIVSVGLMSVGLPSGYRSIVHCFRLSYELYTQRLSFSSRSEV